MVQALGACPVLPNRWNAETAEMFAKIVRYGPYGELGPPAQMNIGAAREKEKDLSAGGQGV